MRRRTLRCATFGRLGQVAELCPGCLHNLQRRAPVPPVSPTTINRGTSTNIANMACVGCVVGCGCGCAAPAHLFDPARPMVAMQYARQARAVGAWSTAAGVRVAWVLSLSRPAPAARARGGEGSRPARARARHAPAVKRHGEFSRPLIVKCVLYVHVPPLIC